MTLPTPQHPTAAPLPAPTLTAAQLPTESSVTAMVSLLREYASDQKQLGWAKDAALLDAAAELLQRCAPQPVPEGPTVMEIIALSAESEPEGQP